MRTYDPTEVQINLGPLTISGFADGSFIKITRSKQDRYSVKVGTKGEVSRSKVTDNSGTITISLKHTSPCNAKLYLLEKSPATFPVTVIENGDTKFVATVTEAWIAKTPEPDFGAEDGKSDWTIGCADLTFAQI